MACRSRGAGGGNVRYSKSNGQSYGKFTVFCFSGSVGISASLKRSCAFYSSD